MVSVVRLSILANVLRAKVCTLGRLNSLILWQLLKVYSHIATAFFIVMFFKLVQPSKAFLLIYPAPLMSTVCSFFLPEKKCEGINFIVRISTSSIAIQSANILLRNSSISYSTGITTFFSPVHPNSRSYPALYIDRCIGNISSSNCIQLATALNRKVSHTGNSNFLRRIQSANAQLLTPMALGRYTSIRL